MEYKSIKIVEPLDLQNEISVRTSQLIDISNFLPVIRSAGSLTNKAVYLHNFINGQEVDEWIMAKDEHGDLCAIPLKKDNQKERGKRL